MYQLTSCWIKTNKVVSSTCTAELSLRNTTSPVEYRRGQSWGPFLFIIHINYINLALQKSQLILYANDTVVFYSGKNVEEIHLILNEELQELACWFNRLWWHFLLQAGNHHRNVAYTLTKTTRLVAIWIPNF